MDISWDKNISWANTAEALQDLASTLVCGKCGFKTVSPTRLINCGHFFCNNCIKFATKCHICDVQIQPREMNPDHVVTNLIQNCDIIADIINKRDLWSNTIIDTDNISENTVSKIVCTPKKTFIPKKKIDKPNYKGETPLHTACLKKNADRVKVLLLAGANPNTKDNAGWTPLQEVVSYGQTELCELLLKGGALPNIPGHDSKRPLHEAAIANRIAEAKLLLQYNAHVDVYDQCGKSPLDYCVSEQMREILTGIHISQSSSEKTSDFNQTLDKSLITGHEKFVILASNLKPENQKLLNFVATRHKFKVLSAYRSSVTHVIVEANEQNITKMTLDVMFAIVRGSWLLNSEWITLANDLDSVYDMDLELFEVCGAPISGVPRKTRQNAELQKPRLFNNCFFYFALQANVAHRIGNVQFTKSDLAHLVREGEGTVLTRAPDPEDLKDMSRVVPFHTADDSSHPLHKCTHYVIYVPGKDEPALKYNMPHIKSLPLVWLIECIEKFTLINPTYLGLS